MVEGDTERPVSHPPRYGHLRDERETWKQLGEGHSADAQRTRSGQQADNFCPVLRVPNAHGAAPGAGCIRGVEGL